MNIITRPITERDVNFLQEMLYEAIFVPEGLQRPGRSILKLPEISRYTDDWGRPGDYGLILDHEDEPIGAAWARLFPEDNKGYGFVDGSVPEMSISLKTGYRDQGLGTRLLEAFLECARKEGFSRISLSVDKRNRAIHLYHRMGFRIVSEHDHSCVMVKNME